MSKDYELDLESQNDGLQKRLESIEHEVEFLRGEKENLNNFTDIFRSCLVGVIARFLYETRESKNNPPFKLRNNSICSDEPFKRNLNFTCLVRCDREEVCELMIRASEDSDEENVELVFDFNEIRTYNSSVLTLCNLYKCLPVNLDLDPVPLDITEDILSGIIVPRIRVSSSSLSSSQEFFNICMKMLITHDDLKIVSFARQVKYDEEDQVEYLGFNGYNFP
jgi:hypothetical protein